MPTKSNNVGGRGGKRIGAGRKKKGVTEKLEAGTPKKEIKVLDIPDVEGVAMPDVSEFLSREQRDGKPFQAKEIFEKTWEWIKNIGCSAIISPQQVERYAMCAARWIQCEEATSLLGLIGKHPTTGKPIPSPFVNIGIQYMNQAIRQWDEIYQIIKENCTIDYSESNPQDDMMERILGARKGK